MTAPDVEAAEARWVAAQELAEGIPDAGSVRRRRRVLLWVAALTASLRPLGLPPICHAPWFTRDPCHSGRREALHLKCLRALPLAPSPS
jgi:hypothetical protein